jgi:hypothetical protein
MHDCIYTPWQRIRHRWLIFNIFSYAYPIVTGVLLTLFFPIDNQHLATVIPLNVTLFALLYYFAYRKSGTRLLAFMMFMKLFSIVMMVGLAHTVTSIGPRILNYGLYIADFFFTIGWISLSFQLRRANFNRESLYKALKKEKVKPVPVLP